MASSSSYKSNSSRSGFKVHITGLDKVMARLDAMELGLPTVIDIAVQRALNVVKLRSREILADADKHHAVKWPNPVTGEVETIEDSKLWKQFRAVIIRIGGEVVSGKLTNTSIAANWLEKGTADHWIGPVNGQSLSFFVAPGRTAASEGHDVHGVEARHFLQDALTSSYGEIFAIFYETLERSGFGAEPQAIEKYISEIFDSDV